MFKVLPSRKFLGSRKGYDEARIILLGVPLDHTESFRPGTRFAPYSIREASNALEEYSLLTDQNILDIPFYDLGELEILPGDISTSLKLIEEVATKIIRDNKSPAIIGGEHLLTYPVIKALKQKFDDLVVFDIDAHFDFRDSYSGMKYSNATVMRRIAEIIGPHNLYQFGIRSGTKEEKDFSTLCNAFPLSVNGLEEALLKTGGRPIYLTVDIDVLDPAFAPGVGTPEPGGISSRELLEALPCLCKGNIVGFDLVEVCPPYDPSMITSILGVKLILELLFLMDKKS